MNRILLLLLLGLLAYDPDTQSFWFHAASGWTELVADATDRLADADGNPQIQVEEGPNDNTIRVTGAQSVASLRLVVI